MNERTNSYAFHPFTWGHAESPPETREPNLQHSPWLDAFGILVSTISPWPLGILAET